VDQGNEEYVVPNDVIAWHLYDDPVDTEATGPLPPRRGPFAEDLDNRHDHLLENGGRLMCRISSLTDQYWGHRLVIKHGAPKLRHVKTRITNTVMPRQERDIVNDVESFEKVFLKLYQRYGRAREFLNSCEKMYRCVERIFILVAESNGNIMPEQLKRKLCVLIDWIRLMDTRRREPSGINERAKHNEGLVYDINKTSCLQVTLNELKEYHDNRFGGLESLLVFINDMLDR
jgi:hypothetical protein